MTEIQCYMKIWGNLVFSILHYQNKYGNELLRIATLESWKTKLFSEAMQESYFKTILR